MKSRKSVLGVVLAVVVSGGWFVAGPRSAWAEGSDQATFSDMDQMLFDARQAFKQQRFDAAITTCEKIIRKDPDNLTALKIMGSGYFMINEYARAGSRPR